jgi:mannosyl-3-phosphoglycerate phosphatase
MKPFAARWLVFTDLDGTLLDGRYDLRSAGGAMDTLHEYGCVCIPASSKTQREMSQLNKTRKFPSPYILENGAGLCWPSAAEAELFGRPASEIYDLLDHIREEHKLRYRTFRDISCEELQALTGLDESGAIDAKQRAASVPLVWEDDPEALEKFSEILGFIGLQVVHGGRFQTVLDAACTKAAAVQKVLEHFHWGTQRPTIIACGDAANDLEMLAMADIAILFPASDGQYLSFQHPALHYCEASGHESWLATLQSLLGLPDVSTNVARAAAGVREQ